MDENQKNEVRSKARTDGKLARKNANTKGVKAGAKEGGAKKGAKESGAKADSVKESNAKPKAPKPDPRWVLFNAENLVVGRLASEIARRLRGKGNPAFLPYKDSGEHVIVVNTDRLHFTGNKRQDKNYYWHTGYPGGIKSRSAKTMFEQNRSCEVLSKAVKGMLPRGVLGREQLKKLRLYSDSEHQHLAQKPQVVDFAAENPKNSKR